MGVRVFKKKFSCGNFFGRLPVIFTLAIIAIVVVGLGGAEEASRAEGRIVLEDALVRAAVHSYAVNGYFPPSLEYIVENFGVYIDTSRFVVHYDVFASNLLPDIRVFEPD